MQFASKEREEHAKKLMIPINLFLGIKEYESIRKQIFPGKYPPLGVPQIDLSGDIRDIMKMLGQVQAFNAEVLIAAKTSEDMRIVNIYGRYASALDTILSQEKLVILQSNGNINSAKPRLR